MKCIECRYLQFNKEYGGNNFSFMLSPIAMYLCPRSGRWWSHQPTDDACEKFECKDNVKTKSTK